MVKNLLDGCVMPDGCVLMRSILSVLCHWLVQQRARHMP